MKTTMEVKSEKDHEMPVQDQQESHGAEMTFYAHFKELRSRLLRCVVGVVVGMMACFSFSPAIYGFLARPVYSALPEEARNLIFLNPVEPFFVYLKISLLTGFIVASPYIFFQIWRFIAPGLYANEKRALIPMVLASTLVFIGGAVFCYVVVLPLGLETLIGAGTTDEFAAVAQISMASYYDLVIRLIAAFGIVFEMPIFSMFLTKLGVITHQTLIKHWRVAVIAIFVLAALLTPPDVLTQITLALPMCLLYGVSIGLSRLVENKTPAGDGGAG